MKRLFILLLFPVILILFIRCDDDKSDMVLIPGSEAPKNEGTGAIPDGFFEVVFSTPESKAPVTGADTRVRDLRYLLFKSPGGEFVKERRIVTPSDPTSVWPLASVRDTLPKGRYQAVFVANAEKTLFPYATPGNSQTYSDVLTGYQSGYSSARIILPNAEFTDRSEYYMANVTFSNANQNPTILLQRIIGMLNVHRNFVDAQTALNKLVNNIVTNIGYKNIIRNQVNNILPGLIRDKLDKGSLLGNTVYDVVGGLDKVVNALVGALVEPVTDALYAILLQQLTNQLGMALTGNANQSGLLAFLGVLLNPWNTSQADAAIISINNFPKSVDLDLNVKDYFSGVQKFYYKFTPGTIYDEKDLLIKNFSGLFDIREINVVKTGLVAGLLIDRTIDGSLLLNGTFVDIKDPLSYTNKVNRRYKTNYSFLDLGLKSYATNSSSPLTLSVSLGSIPNLDGIVKGLPLLGPILNGVINTLILDPLKTITVSVPVNLPLLGVSNLSLSGGWDTPVSY